MPLRLVGSEMCIRDSVYIAVIDAAAAESVVVAAIAARFTSTAARADPTLNPYQPNHKINTPKAPATIELPGSGSGEPLSSYFTILGQTIITHARAANPPTMWTTPDPAKSINPKSPSHP
mgnify:CR=1 FL=1